MVNFINYWSVEEAKKKQQKMVDLIRILKLDVPSTHHLFN